MDDHETKVNGKSYRKLMLDRLVMDRTLETFENPDNEFLYCHSQTNLTEKKIVGLKIFK